MSRDDALSFYHRRPNRETSWRSLILFGRNVASYKFALGHALLELADTPSDLVALEDLAQPYVRHLCRHLVASDKQGISATSRLLDACRSYNAGELSEEVLIERTVRLGFNNVIDAFHVVGPGPIERQFYVDERGLTKPGIRLTDELRRLAASPHADGLIAETDSRWRLVERAWELQLPSHLVQVTVDDELRHLTLDRNGNRRPVTAVSGALSGYQRGLCFYCGRVITPGETDVDHFLPRSLRNLPGGFAVNLDGVWNLVLACLACNRGVGGKMARVPQVQFLKKLHRRNEYYIASAHPLRETIINQTGESTAARRGFLNRAWNDALGLLPHPWEPVDSDPDPDL